MIDVETGRPISNVLALLEVDSQQVCGLQFTAFSSENFGWWSCDMNEEVQNSVLHRGTFKINKPDEWPTDIRLPTFIEVLKLRHEIHIQHFPLEINCSLFFLTMLKLFLMIL